MNSHSLSSIEQAIQTLQAEHPGSRHRMPPIGSPEAYLDSGSEHPDAVALLSYFYNLEQHDDTTSYH